MYSKYEIYVCEFSYVKYYMFMLISFVSFGS